MREIRCLSKPSCFQASQLARETSSREARGKDSAKFATGMLAGANSVHACKEEDLKESEDEDSKPKEKKKPLAERMQDQRGPCRLVASVVS